MLGKFDYSHNCSLLNFIPQGMEEGGRGVIVFPKNPKSVVPGRLYEFDPVMTVRAVYVLDGITYRVAHAVNLQDAQDTEGSFLDVLTHVATPKASSTLADAIMDPATRALLEQMRA